MVRSGAAAQVAAATRYLLLYSTRDLLLYSTRDLLLYSHLLRRINT